MKDYIFNDGKNDLFYKNIGKQTYTTGVALRLIIMLRAETRRNVTLSFL